MYPQSASIWRVSGGFYSTDSDTVNISGKVSFVENFAFTDGGAISINVGGDVFVEGATFILNEAAAGGASSIVATDQDIFLDIYFRWCTFDNNTATEGGALYLFNSAQSVEVHESVFRNNTAGTACTCHTIQISPIVTRYLFIVRSELGYLSQSVRLSVVLLNGALM